MTDDSEKEFRDKLRADPTAPIEIYILAQPGPGPDFTVTAQDVLDFLEEYDDD